MTAVDELVAEGRDAGQVRIRLWRPFPEEEFLAACAGAEKLIVIDRALSPGAVCGPVASELKSLLYGRPGAPEIVNVIAGLGGRDVTVREFKEMFAMASSGKLAGNYMMWGVESHAS
jgi:pyruvate ferredoxin oxidoreductase alpha subunit